MPTHKQITTPINKHTSLSLNSYYLNEGQYSSVQEAEITLETKIEGRHVWVKIRVSQEKGLDIVHKPYSHEPLIRDLLRKAYLQYLEDISYPILERSLKNLREYHVQLQEKNSD